MTEHNSTVHDPLMIKYNLNITMLILVMLGDFNASVDITNNDSKHLLHAFKQLFDELGLISCDYLDTFD